MRNLKLANFGVVEMTDLEIKEKNGRFLPLAVVVGIWAFQGACALVALGMKARLDQEN